MPVKHVLIIAMLIAVACAFATFSPPVKAAANIIVASHSSYRDVLNDYWVFGEVKNIGDTPATNIWINASFYDASDNFINSSKTAIVGFYGAGQSIVLLPGAKAPFYMLLLPQSGTVNFDHYGFAFSFEECAGKNGGLQIPFSSCFRYLGVSVENVNVSGAIKNTESLPQDWINVYATVYDSTGKVIGQGYWYKEILLPGEVAGFNFQIATFYPAQTVNYTVTAQSADYAIASESNGVVIPEFSSFLTILPLMATVTAILIFRKKRQI